MPGARCAVWRGRPRLASADPHTLADWWADALGREVEPSDEPFIRGLIEAGHATEADTKAHRATLVRRSGAGIRHRDADPEGNELCLSH
ncbi:hypothetical protein ACIQZO_04085 [Streptomyces sp. NPDC097617]|uniref:hypothetical protein n=1 Tax=Streptomyces sp. NPDC097617 TaxID=3366091 RepID=UPI00382E9A33